MSNDSLPPTRLHDAEEIRFPDFPLWERDKRPSTNWTRYRPYLEANPVENTK